MEETEDNTDAQKDPLWIWTGRSNVAKMTSATPVKILMAFLTENTFKICVEIKMTTNENKLFTQSLLQ